jgi:hypothetical protein
MMKMSNYKNNKVFITIATSLAVGIWSLPAYAYLDPGTGSMLIQGIIGVVAAAGVALKLYWHKIKLMISGRKAESETISKSQGSVSKD